MVNSKINNKHIWIGIGVIILLVLTIGIYNFSQKEKVKYYSDYPFNSLKISANYDEIPDKETGNAVGVFGGILEQGKTTSLGFRLYGEIANSSIEKRICLTYDGSNLTNFKLENDWYEEISKEDGIFYEQNLNQYESSQKLVEDELYLPINSWLQCFKQTNSNIFTIFISTPNNESYGFKYLKIYVLTN